MPLHSRGARRLSFLIVPTLAAFLLLPGAAAADEVSQTQADWDLISQSASVTDGSLAGESEAVPVTASDSVAVVTPSAVATSAAPGSPWSRPVPASVVCDASGWCTWTWREGYWFRLRRSGTGLAGAVASRGNDIVLSDVDASQNDVVATIGDGIAETFATTTASLGGASVDWDFAYSEGVRIQVSDTGFLVIVEDGPELVRVTADAAESQSGTDLVVNQQSQVDELSRTGTLSMDMSAQFGALVPGERVLADPTIAYLPTTGAAERYWSRAHSPANATDVRGTSDTGGWYTYGNPSEFTFTNPNYVAAYGIYVGNSGASMALNHYGRYQYVAPTNSKIASMDFIGTYSFLHAEYGCRLVADDGVTARTSNWYPASPSATTSNFTASLDWTNYASGGGTRFVRAGIELYKRSGSSPTSHSMNYERCSLEGNTGNVYAKVWDEQQPTINFVTTPSAWPVDSGRELVADSNAADGVSKWYKPGDKFDLWLNAADQGLGIDRTWLTVNGVMPSSSFKDECPVGDFSHALPCPLSVPLRSITTSLPAPTMYQGANSVLPSVRDITNRGTSTATSLSFYYDSLAPNAPSTPLPNSSTLAGGGGSATLSWLPATDQGTVGGATPTGSGIAKYLVCAARTTTGCDDPTDNSPSKFTFAIAAPYTSITAQLASGTWYWRVRAVDVAGNIGAASTVATLNLDASAPAVSLTAPSNALSLRAATAQTFTATAVDDDGLPSVPDSGVSNVSFLYRKSDAGTWSSFGSDTTAPYSVATTVSLPDGSYDIAASASDSVSAANVGMSDIGSLCVDSASLSQPAWAKHRLVGSPVSSGEIWWAPPTAMSGIAGFLVERQDSTGGPWTLVARVGVSELVASDNAVTSSTAMYRVESIGQACTTTAKGVGAVSTQDAAGATAVRPTSMVRVGSQPWWQTISTDLGADASAGVNVAGGNLTIGKALATAQGAGVSVSASLVHNSQERGAHSSKLALDGIVGEAWTLGFSDTSPGQGISTMTGVSAEPITMSGGAMTIRDQDATPMVFTSAGGGLYTAPDGVFAYVRDIQATAETNDGVVGTRIKGTRPDRVSYYWANPAGTDPTEDDGRVLAMRDRDNRGVTFQYHCVQVDDTTHDVDDLGANACSTYTSVPGNFTKRYRLSAVTTAGGRSMTFTYFDREPADAGRALDGRLQSINDLSGTVTAVSYDNTSLGILVSPRLHSITDAQGTGVARSSIVEHDLGDDLSTKWVDESQLVTRYVDPRGGATRFAYALSDRESIPRVTSVTDRVNNSAGKAATRYDWGVASGQLTGTVTIRDQLSNATVLRFDGNGRVYDTVAPTGEISRTEYNAKNEPTAQHVLLREDEARTVTGTTPSALTETTIAAWVEVRVNSAPDQAGTAYVEGTDYTLVRSNPASIARTSTSSIPSGASIYISYFNSTAKTSYDSATGFVTAQWAPKGTTSTPGQLANPTQTTYTNSALSGTVKDVATVTTPRGSGTADVDDFMTSYVYDSSLRLVDTVTPINASSGDAADLAHSQTAYYSSGDVRSQTAPDGVTTGYSDYDASGQPTWTYKPVTGTFTPGTGVGATPVATISIFDNAGRTTCADNKLETGDASSISPCVWTTSGGTNREYETTKYDALGRATSTTSAFNNTQRKAQQSVFDANGNATQSTDAIAYTPTSADPWAISSPSAGSITSTYFNANDQTMSTQLPSNSDDDTLRLAVNTYDAAGHLITETTPEGTFSPLDSDYKTTHAYDASGREIGTLNGNKELSCTFYNRLGQAYATAEAPGLGSALPCPASPPATWVTTHTFDRAGRQTSTTDRTGRTSSQSYDEEDNVVAETDTAGATTTSTVDASGNTLATTEAAHAVCASSTDCLGGNLVTKTPTAATTYTATGDVSAEIDARQAAEGAASTDFKTQYTYNENGDLVTTKLADDGSVSSGDSTRYVHQIANSEGETVATTLQTTTSSAPTEQAATACTTGGTAGGVSCDTITKFTPAPDGSIVGKSDGATGTSSTTTYNAAGQLDSRTEHGVATSYAYYADGSLSSETSVPLPKEFTTYGLYSVGDCVNPHTGPGTLYRVTDSQLAHTAGSSVPTWPTTGSVTSGDVTFTVSTCQQVVKHYYDRGGIEIKTVTQIANGATTSFEITSRDGIGRILRSVDVDGTETINTYDRAGNKTTETVNGRKSTWAYGTSGSDTGLQTGASFEFVTVHDGGISATFTYDTAGRLATVTRNTAYPTRTTYTYDAVGNLTNQNTLLMSGGTPLPNYTLQNTDYAYDADGHLRLKKERARRANPAQQFVGSYPFALGTVVEPNTPNGHQYIVTTAGTTGTTTPVWPTGERATVTSGTEVFTEMTAITQYVYDGQGRLVRELRPDNPATSAVEGERDYQFDATGRIGSITAPCTGGTGTATLEAYTYATNDPSLVTGVDRNALTSGACSSQVDSSTVSLGYNQTPGQEGAATTVTVDPGATGGGDAVTTNFQQDENNQLQAQASSVQNPASAPTATASIQRDADGTRVADVTANGTVAYDHADGGDETSGVAEPGDDEPVGYLKDPNGLTIGILHVTPSDDQYVVSDPQNTPLLIENTGGYVTQTQDYDAYGQPETLMASGSAAATSIGYTGVRTDPTTGLIDNQARTYNPVTRTWMTTDEYRDPDEDATLSTDASNQGRQQYGMHRV